MNRAYLISILISMAQFGYSQNYIDLANVNYSISPSTSDTNALTEKTGIHIQIPLVLKNEDVILTGLGGAVTQIRSTNDSSEYKQDLHNVILLVGYKKQINEKLSWLGLMLNQINAGPENVSLKYYQPGFYTLFTIEKSKSLRYKLGALYKYEFSGPFIIPLVGVDWQVNDKLQVFGTLPISANIIYRPREKVGFGLSFKGSIATYGLESGGTATYIQENNNEIHALLDFYVTKRLVVQTKVGMQVGNKYKRYSPDDKVDASMGPVVLGDKRTPITSVYGSGIAYKLSLIYRFSLKED